MTGFSVNSQGLSPILQLLYKGEWQVPEFQREFIWSVGDVVALAESVVRGRPIGMATLWALTDEQAESFGLENADIRRPNGTAFHFGDDSSAAERTNRIAILDGRQRCTALAAIFGGLRSDHGAHQHSCSYFLNLDAEEDDLWVEAKKKKEV